MKKRTIEILKKLKKVLEEYYIESELIVKQKIEDSDDSSDEEYAPEANLEKIETFDQASVNYARSSTTSTTNPATTAIPIEAIFID